MKVLEQALRLVAVLVVAAMACVACMSGPVSDQPIVSGEEAVQDYKLGPGDRLKINVFGEESLSGEFVVSPTGSVAYPLIGDFEAEGKTVPGFTEGLTEALQRFVRHPNISVEVMNYRPYYILGEVKNPSTYPYTSGLTIFNAAAIAGGFSERADTRRVYIRHMNEAAEKQYRLTTDTRVQPGDTVRIPERRF